MNLVTCLNGHPLGVERLETRIGLIVPFFGNGVLDESDTDSDESEDQPEKYTISAFGEISLSEAYITEQVGPAGPATRKPRLQLSRPQMPRGRTRSGKSSPEFTHEAFLKSLRCVTANPPTSPTSDFRSLFETWQSSRSLLMSTHACFTPQPSIKNLSLD